MMSLYENMKESQPNERREELDNIVSPGNKLTFQSLKI